MTLRGIDIPVGGDLAVLGFDEQGAASPGSGAFPDLLRGMSERAWERLRARLPELMRQRLGRADLLAPGFSLYDIDVSVSPESRMTVQRTDAGDLTVHVVTGRNTIIATTTTPTVFGSWGDPRFSVDFGITFDYLVDVPPVAGPLGLTGFTDLRITMPRVDSQNLVADLILVPVRLAELFTDWSLDGTLGQLLASVDLADEANDRLGEVNATLQDLAGRGFHYLELLVGDPAELARQLGARAAAGAGLLEGLVPDAQTLLLVCRRPDTSGVIEGEISWPAADGRPLDPAAVAILDSLAAPVLARGALAMLQARASGEPEPDLVLQPGEAVPLDRAVLRSSVEAYAAAPAAAALQLSALGSGQAVRMWDSRGEAPRTEAPPAPLAAWGRTDFEAQVGGTAAYERLADLFRRGPLQLTVTCTVPDAGGSHRTGSMVAMWLDDDEAWCRRRFRVEDVETDQPLTVTCALADGWTWRPGRVAEITPRNWSGTVTVRPALDFATLLRDGALQVTVLQRDGSRRTVAVELLERIGAVRRPDGAERGIIVVGGTPADEVALNPQPLPPRVLERLRESLGQDRAIIVVGGRPGEEVELNPQPLPPRWREELLGQVRGTAGLVVRGRRDDAGRVLVGRARVDDEGVDLGRLGGLGRFVQRVRSGDGAAGSLGARVRVGRDAAGSSAVGGVGGVGDGRAAGRAGVETAALDVERAVQTAVDRFGDLVATSIDPDVLIPDVTDPTGHGTVRGVDFRVWVQP